MAINSPYLDEAMKRLQSTLMQDWLYKRQHERTLGTIGAEYEKSKTLADEAFQRRIREIMFEKGMSLDNKIKEVTLEIGKHPGYTQAMMNAYKADVLGKKDEAQKFRDEATAIATNMAGAAETAVSTGKVDTTGIENLIKGFGPGDTQSLLGTAATRQTQLENLPIREKELDIRGKEAAARQLQARGKMMELDKWQKNETIKIIKDAEDFLIGEGVKADATMPSLAALFGSNKTYDPLKPELRGRALADLTKIRFKLVQDRPISQGEMNFISNIKNSVAVNTKGYVSPETGITEVPKPETDAAIREGMISAKAQEILDIMQMTNPSQETKDWARSQAIAYLTSMKIIK